MRNSMEVRIMVTCKECNKRFRIKLNFKFGIILKGGYQTTCPCCGYIVYLDEISKIRRLMHWAGMLVVTVACLIAVSTRTLYMHERLIIVGGVVVFAYVIERLLLRIAGRMYDKQNKH